MKPLQHRIDQFLFNYGNTPTGVTEETPAQLFLSWKPRTRLSLLHPHIEQRMREKLERTRQSANRRRGAWRDFVEGEDVFVHGLRPGEAEWLSGKETRKFKHLGDKGRERAVVKPLPASAFCTFALGLAVALAVAFAASSQRKNRAQEGVGQFSAALFRCLVFFLVSFVIGSIEGLLLEAYEFHVLLDQVVDV
ncbi:hypothetical protein HPB50_020311 [Hyalomma asiaticum]|uniref:Uncharacterized protein n=1 Tax=Hyalomma asiaticum TaxID=266040 RepID=A0ACB7RM49_HYAAI|nr:hypothetical protein HPB50_020311 [Hyalomma asiaticum]